jgi:hypothetical protein
MVFETILQSDLQKMVNVKQLTGNLFSADNGGNKITVEILDGGAPATVSGSVYGYAIREDGKTVVIEGTLSGNKASIVLPASAYAVIGKLNIVIKVGTATVGACQAYVYRTTTDAIVDPGSVVPDISELLAQIGACEEATTAANTAASAANTAAANVGNLIAPAYANLTFPISKGQPCIYNNVRYQANQDIATSEGWTASHWSVMPNVSDESNALKSALNNDVNNTFEFSPQSAWTSASGWRINADTGLSYSDSGYKLVKYVVTPGDVLKVVSDDKFQFQNNASVPSQGTSNRVGITYSDGEYLVKVPTGATWLIISTPTTSNAGVYSIKTWMETIDETEESIASVIGPIIFKEGYSWNTNEGVINSSSSNKASPKLLFNPKCNFYAKKTTLSAFLYWSDSAYLGYTSTYNPSAYNNIKYVATYCPKSYTDNVYYRSEEDQELAESVEALGLELLQTTKVSGYTSTPLEIESGETYVIDIVDYTGNEGGAQFAAYKTGEASIDIAIIKENRKIVWKAPKDCDGFYTGACTYRVFLADKNSILLYRSDVAENKIITVGSTGCDYTSFTDALKYAYSVGNVTLELAAEVFDIMQETDIADEGAGLPLGNGIHIIGRKGTVIKCDYEGGVGTLQRDFAVFNAYPSDFTMENIRIEGTNVRYCVHDDCGNTNTAYTHRYINCEMYHDSSEALWRNSQCIGGGFGVNGFCEVIGGIYEGVPVHYSLTNDIGGPYSETELNCPISWHQNNYSLSAENTLVIRDCYLVGTDSLIIYGTGVNGNVFLSGNSYGKAPRAYYDSNLYAWNNELRTN